MVLDIILVVLFLLMMLYGYKKGCIGIVAKLVSLIVAFVLAYLLAGTVGRYISQTSFGKNVSTNIETNILEKIGNSEEIIVISTVQENLSLESENTLIQKITSYVFTGIGFVCVFIVARIVLWIGQKILESIFELPVLKTFNKLGGVITATVLLLVEVSIILAVIKSISTLEFMTSTINVIQSSVITKALYEHNIFTNLILSKIF